MSTTWARLGIIAVAPIAALAQDEAPGAPPEGSPWVEPSEGIEGGEQVEVADPAEPVEVAAEAAAVGRPAP
ncbi:MAG TPA: hypothetical protein PKA64_12660, partial [Myxococcota bacterium]|nr:hypothetical protein [Myxococcota bacterium]